MKLLILLKDVLISTHDIYLPCAYAETPNVWCFQFLGSVNHVLHVNFITKNISLGCSGVRLIFIRRLHLLIKNNIEILCIMMGWGTFLV